MQRGAHSAYDRSPLWMLRVYPLAISEAMPLVTAIEGFSSRPGSLEPSAWACRGHPHVSCLFEVLILACKTKMGTKETLQKPVCCAAMQRRGTKVWPSGLFGGKERRTCPISADMTICRNTNNFSQEPREQKQHHSRVNLQQSLSAVPTATSEIEDHCQTLTRLVSPRAGALTKNASWL